MKLLENNSSIHDNSWNEKSAWQAVRDAYDNVDMLRVMIQEFASLLNHLHYVDDCITDVLDCPQIRRPAHINEVRRHIVGIEEEAERFDKYVSKLNSCKTMLNNAVSELKTFVNKAENSEE